MKIAERIVIVLLLIGIVGSGVWFVFYVRDLVADEHQQKVEDVALGKYQIPTTTDEPEVTPETWQTIYPNTVTILIGETTVKASIADSLSERIGGLSGTPFLPDNVVKLFVFGTAGTHSIWMKDMNYSLDIMWLDQTGGIVHLEENVSPDTYPESFSSPVSAWYVVEATAGFVAVNNIKIGDKVVLPTE